VSLIVQTEKHRASETVVLGQDAGQRWAGFLTSVLVVTREEYDVSP
jgi:hypothetical protein